MRYIAKVLKNSLHKKFPDASEDELLKVETLEPFYPFALPTRSPALLQLQSESPITIESDVAAFLSGRS